MKRFYMICAVLTAFCACASGYTLDGATNLVVTNVWDVAGEDMIIGDTSSSNTLTILSGGTVSNLNTYVGNTASSVENRAEVSGTNAVWINSGILQIGSTGNSNNTVSVSSNGTVMAEALVISENNTFNLNDGGTLKITGNFDADSQTNMLWSSGGHLSVGGSLTKSSGLDGVERTLTLDDGSWVLPDSLTISGTSNQLNIVNGGTVSNIIGYVTGTGNVVTVEGDGSRWVNSGTLDISGTNNAVTVQDDGTVEAESLLISENNVFNLNDGGTLKITGNFDADSQTNLIWNSGGHLSVGGTLTKTNGLDGEERTLTLDGGSWTLPDSLTISGTSNQLNIINGAHVFVGEQTIALLGLLVASTNGAIFSLSDSSVFIEGGLYIGLDSNRTGTASLDNGKLAVGDVEIKAGSELQLSSSSVFVEGDMTVDNATLAGEGTVQFGDGMNTLSISGSNTVVSSALVFDGGAGEDSLFLSDQLLSVTTLSGQYVDFEAINLIGSLLSGNGSVGLTNGSVNISDTRLELNGVLTVEGELSLADVELIVDLGVGRLAAAGTNAVDVSSVKAEVTVLPDQEVYNLTNSIISAGGEVLGWSDGESIINENYLLYDFSFSTASNSVDVVSTPVDGDTLSSTLAYAGSEGVRAGFNGMKNTVFTRTRQLRRNLVATQHLLPSAPAEAAPEGALGPGERNVIFSTHLWMQYFNGEGEHDAHGVSDGFRMYNSGSSIGLDRLVGDALIVGINYTHTLSDARADNGDAVDAETFWFGAYGEWVSRDGLYVDALAAYGKTDYNTLRLETDYSGRADYGGDSLGAYVDVGQYYYIDRLSLAPYAGLHVLAVSAESHTETESGGGTLQVDEDERSWIESAVGLKARYRMDTGLGRIQTLLYAEWLHDLDQEDVQTVLSDGTAPSVGLAVVSPDADIFNTGLGLSWFRSDFMEVGIGYQGRFSEHYEEHTGSLMLDVMF